jgi:PPOX class probable F420-dependent enzyme
MSLHEAKYIAFGTYRADGTIKTTPVWIVPYDTGFAFTTEVTSHKVRRLENDARCTVVSSTFKGVPLDGEPVHTGRARIVRGDEYRAIHKKVTRKYPLMSWFVLGPMDLLARLRGRSVETVGVVIELDEADQKFTV